MSQAKNVRFTQTPILGCGFKPIESSERAFLSSGLAGRGAGVPPRYVGNLVPFDIRVHLSFSSCRIVG